MAAGLERGRLELYLPAIDRAVAQARAAVDRLDTLDSHPDARFAVRLLVSELFTNGRLSRPAQDAESGRGLAFLDAIADRWGVIRDGENCVWFELDLDGE